MSKEKHEEQSQDFTYDVFLSFRGEDTRHNFIGHLLDALKQRRINTFFDDKNLEIGKDISPALSKAIEESKIAVVVFSRNYASSRWCLGELVKIMECFENGKKKQIVFPIFFHVDPSDVRNQRKSYGDAMVDHEKKFGKDSKNIKAWKSALSKAADLKGHHIDTGFEIEHIKKIVEKINANITPKPLPSSGDDPVGLEQHVENVRSLLDHTDHTVCMLGIYGLGGIGKTELANLLFNKIVHQFEAASFLSNVRMKSNRINGLEDLQKTLLSEMFQHPETELGSTTRGICEIRNKLCKKKILLVLDDVDDMKQLENLAGGSDWFGPGSKIIVTTRDKGLFMGKHPIELQKVYEMPELNYEHSLELFCRHAFKESHPEKGYEAMSSRAVGYAKGLPLALKVIGSNLHGEKSIGDWGETLKYYERTSGEGIHEVLKVSYDVLRPDAQGVFLDIACFFKGERMEYVAEILGEFNAKYIIKKLVDKSLLIDDNGCLDMHDLIQDMGREIVKQEAPQDPAKRSRLWFHKDVFKVLSNEDKGSGVIQGIMLDPPKRKRKDWSDTAFKKMDCLRILIVRNTTFSSEPKHLPNSLKLLDWAGYPSNSFPPNFYPKEIIVFNLPYCQLTLKEPFKKFKHLTVMNFSHNESITTFPDVSKVENLREIRLDNCKELSMVHESIGFLKHLVHLSVSGCLNLQNFLKNMFLPSLEFLDLNLCAELKHFPVIDEEMYKTLKIFMINTAIEKLPDSVGNLIGLVSIDMSNSWKLKHLPSSLFKLPNVVTFKFEGCSQLGESMRRFLYDIPSATNGHSTLKTLNFGKNCLSDRDLQKILTYFRELQELIVSDNHFVSPPVCIKESTHLTTLDVSGCNMLREIPICTNLRILNVYGCVKLQHISKLPCTIQKVDARYCCHLNKETSDMLWDQVKKERRGLEIVMPQKQTRVPHWFNFSCRGGNPRFWVRNQFPVVALAFVFQKVRGSRRRYRRLLVDLQLVINGRSVIRKGYYNFKIEENHVLICDLRLLFSDKEWVGLDALLVDHEWNQVEILHEAPSSVTLSDWGVFVYKEGATNMKESVKFRCPDPKYYYSHSQIANIVPPEDSFLKQKKLIEALALDSMLPGMLQESENNFGDKKQLQELIVMVGGLGKEAENALQGKPLDKNSPLEWILGIISKDSESEDETTHFDNIEEMSPPIGIEEASTSSHQGSFEAQDNNAEEEVTRTRIFLNGMREGLREAQSIFPSLDIKTTMNSALNGGEWVRISLPPESEVEMKIYMEGIINGLLEAKLSFPTLKEWEILNTVLWKGGHNVMFPKIDWTTIVIPNSDDPFLSAFTNLREEGSESVTEHENLAIVLKGRAEELQRLLEARIEESQNSNENYDLMTATYSHGMRDGSLEAQALLFSLDMYIITCGNENEISAQDADSGKESYKDVTKYKKLVAVLKEKGEKLSSLYDSEIEEFQKSEEFDDLISATYLYGLVDGVVEVYDTLLAMNRKTHVHEENEEHDMDETDKDATANTNHVDRPIDREDIPSPTVHEENEEHDMNGADKDAAANTNHDDKPIDREDIPSPTVHEENEEHDMNGADKDATANTNHDDKPIDREDIPSPTGLETQDTPYPYGYFWRLFYSCFCKCFS